MPNLSFFRTKRRTRRGAALVSAAVFSLTLAGLTGSVIAAEKEAEPDAGEKLFALQVKPLLTEKCLACHGKDPDKIKGDFDLSTLESLKKGGETFGHEVLIPGDAAASILYTTVTREEEDYEMPPKEAEKLTQEETWLIRDWIDSGAPWPDEDRIAWIQENFAEGVIVKTSGGLADEWTYRRYQPENLWAYQPVTKPETGERVDDFIDAKLTTARLEPAPAADRRTLIRRVTLDLLGLPPSPEEVKAFVNDPRPDEEAFASLVDQLLASPHYGEQWGRHWLDVVRYADSSGFANDYERPNAWRYRDYVIRSFNDDKPYDQFIREQIAGDEIDRDDPEMLIAAGFLRMGPWEHTGMSVAKVTRQQFLDDITDSVGQVFLAHALQCARCHDHKFDPVPTRDYYSLQACFATTQFADVKTEWVPGENLDGMEEDKHYHTLASRQNQATLAKLAEIEAANDLAFFQERGLPYKNRQEAKKAGAPKEDIPSGNNFTNPDEFGQERIARKWNTRFDWEFDRYKPVAFTVYNGKTRNPKMYSPQRMPEDPMGEGELERTAILTGGDPFSPGQKVSPGPLSAVPGALDVKFPKTVNGRRTALADWIADPDNSLTARVMVNRVWTWHLGQGIAGNPNNFGATGKKPTHPELLDWLATEFIESGWSVKHLHRLILNSDAWRRSSEHPDHDKLREKDPNHQLYATFIPRRLEAEEIRDLMLACSGELNPELGGIPIRPDINLEAALQPRMIMGTFAPSYQPNPEPERRNRRSIYAHKIRGLRDPFMETFNQPGPDKSCELRDMSNVTPQVFMLFNSQESYDRSLALANRLVAETSGDDEAAIQMAFQTVYGRPAEPEELDATLSHWRALTEQQKTASPKPLELPVTVERRANEENTGKVFSFTEKLFALEDYVPDLQGCEVDARTRALADVCLVLFNSNEFIYVY